ncbi:MAG TPA: universal stress protein [Hyphomicrobiaceae bacterium]|nr:universal stress protein [Hyphomicrobiaceae bacterium]
MTYKTILMHCNDKRRINALLAPTLTLASAFESHVVGLSVIPPVSVVATGALEAPPIIVDAHCELYRKDIAPMRQQFEAAMSGRPVTFEWRDLDAGGFAVSDVVLNQGRAADLIVASQTDPDWPLSEWLDVADDVAAGSGRPVLIIPNGRASALVGSRVLVAWKGTREAARAAFDAVPILKRASAVRVISIGESDADTQPATDICPSLARHGVNVEKAEQISTATGAGPALVAEADAFEADLVVMGCYGHSRLREFVFGGATRHVLQKMRVPVLMSH